MDENAGSEFSSFMVESQTKEGVDSTKNGKGGSKKNTLDEIRQEEEDKKKKEVDDAKKEAERNMSKYSSAQINLTKARGKQLLVALPFIVVGAIAFLVIITNGGTWMQKGMNFLVRKVTGE
jgi:hypothetical protein